MNLYFLSLQIFYTTLKFTLFLQDFQGFSFYFLHFFLAGDSDKKWPKLDTLNRKKAKCFIAFQIFTDRLKSYSAETRIRYIVGSLCVF